MGSGKTLVRGAKALIGAAVAAVLGVGALVAAFLFLSKRAGGLRSVPLVRVEFWIYCKIEAPPTDAQVLDRLVAKTPFRNSPIGTREAMTFSDIRFHIAVLRRPSNELMFHPEMHADADSNPPANLSEILKECDSLIKVCFISEEAVSDSSHLLFTTYAAEAIGHLTNASLVFDVEAQKYFGSGELTQTLSERNDAASFDANVSIIEQETPLSVTYLTRGMNKIGLPDLFMDGLPPDTRSLGGQLIESAAEQLWDRRRVDPIELELFGDTFFVQFTKPHKSGTHRGFVTDMIASRKVLLGPT